MEKVVTNMIFSVWEEKAFLAHPTIQSKIMTPSFYYYYVIWVPNGNEFLEGEGSPELKYDSSKKVFYNHKKVSLKSSFDH